jgi:hypothetical protein
MTLLAFAGIPDSAGDAISIVLAAVMFGLLALALRGLDEV